MGQHAIELAHGARLLGIDLTEDQQSQLLAYLTLLNKWNKAYNLTAVRNPDEMVSRHLLDSFKDKVPLQIRQAAHRLLIGVFLQEFTLLADQCHRINAQVIFLQQVIEVGRQYRKQGLQTFLRQGKSGSCMGVRFFNERAPIGVNLTFALLVLKAGYLLSTDPGSRRGLAEVNVFLQILTAQLTQANAAHKPAPLQQTLNFPAVAVKRRAAAVVADQKAETVNQIFKCAGDKIDVRIAFDNRARSSQRITQMFELINKWPGG